MTDTSDYVPHNVGAPARNLVRAAYNAIHRPARSSLVAPAAQVEASALAFVAAEPQTALAIAEAITKAAKSLNVA